MSIKKLWDYAIETKEGFVPRNVKIYDKKILVVIRELENWRYLLESANSSLRFRETIRI